MSQHRVSTATSDDLRREIATANRVLVHLGVLDAFGHVSARPSPGADRFLLSRNLAPASVTPDDVLEHDLNGEVLDRDARPYLERFIHAEIYRHRPDVVAVVHSHSAAVVPFSVSSRPLRPLIHMAGFIEPAGAPVFEISDVAGDGSTLLITDSKLGNALAQTLGEHAVALMRGHGSVSVGASLPEVVYRAYYAEVNARAQFEAMTIDRDPRFLTPQEAAAANAAVGSQVDRAWNVWCSQVGADW